jgi:TetR/AcrR family transcriptional regulator, hemagglutinin/protease regulatory protein
MMQMINSPQRPARVEVTEFLFKYVTAPLQP